MISYHGGLALTVSPPAAVIGGWGDDPTHLDAPPLVLRSAAGGPVKLGSSRLATPQAGQTGGGVDIAPSAVPHPDRWWDHPAFDSCSAPPCGTRSPVDPSTRALPIGWEFLGRGRPERFAAGGASRDGLCDWVTSSSGNGGALEARRVISSRRQRFSFESGRVSIIRTQSPTAALFVSSCTLKELCWRMTRLYFGCRTSWVTWTTMVFIMRLLVTIPVRTFRLFARAVGSACCSCGIGNVITQKSVESSFL